MCGMRYTKTFKELGRSDADIAGGKGASLGEMTNAGIPVPFGFVVLSTSFDFFLKETDLISEVESELSKVNHKEIESVERASERIRELIENAVIPEELKKEIQAQFKELDTEFVAVRSSATAEDGKDHAWAGQLDSFLNTTKEDLIRNMQRCFSSLFTPRAIFYRFEKGLHNSHISVAVVVQKMIQSEKSGIAFSVHPVTEDYNQMIIEGSWGLGEAIVSGQITPDSYVVTKKEKEILDINIAEKTRGLFKSKVGTNEWEDIEDKKANSQCLSNKEILELGVLVQKIENHYGFPCDIEWAFEAGKFYITQSRPITTLKTNDPTSDKAEEVYPVVWEGIRLNWVKFLERKRTPFIYFPFIEIESQRMPEICGFRFFYHLYKWVGETGVHFRVADELVKCDSHFLGLIKSNDPRLEDWAKKGHKANELADQWLHRFKNMPESFSVSLFNQFYEDFIQILLYTATMPYLVLSSIDNELTKGESRDSFKTILDLYEPLRNTSKYPELERVVLNKWFDEIGEKYGIDSAHVHFMTPDEIRNIETRGVDQSDLLKRKEWSILWNDIRDNEPVFSFDTSIERSIPILNEQVDDTDTLKGSVAFPGYAKGTVRIVNVLDDGKNFVQGDVLVSINTNPDLIPIIKKSSAIITDEGGIMCHAAIVSREFKIPCIIGTKIATKILKDGDVVEVDAERGVVKILGTKNGLVEKNYLEEREWFIAVTRNMSFWHQYLATSGWFNHMTDFDIDFKLESLSITTDGTHTQCFFYNPHYKDFTDVLAKSFGDRGSIEKLKSKIVAYGDELLDALDETMKNLTISTLRKFFDLYERYTASLMITTGYSKKGTDILNDLLLKKGYSESEIPEMIATITYPDAHTPLFDSQTRLVSIGRDVQNGILDGDRLDQVLGEWVEKYGNIPVNYCEDAWTLKNAREQLAVFLDKDCTRELENMELSHQKKIFEAKQMLEKVNDEEIAIVAYGLAQGTYLNEYRKNIFSTTSLRYRKIFKTIAELCKSDDWRDCFFLTPEDMIEVLAGNKISLSQIKESRKKVGITTGIDGKLAPVSKHLIEHLIGGAHSQSQNSQKVDFFDTNEIKGFSANKGIVTGVVKVVLSSKEFHKVNVGDILVATMTSVDFVPIMEKASAFITNEGGIMCHASIVAREMNKPCIIGTKIATKVLKDGDMVEVDAERGVVRIIKKKNEK